mgnify:FL=1
MTFKGRIQFGLQYGELFSLETKFLFELKKGHLFASFPFLWMQCYGIPVNELAFWVQYPKRVSIEAITGF